MSCIPTCGCGHPGEGAREATWPSIFNDVIGPVMRGPSSSHCAAALRITRLARDLMAGCIERVLIEFDPLGSLATTHESQGSDMGLFGGLMGWETHDSRLADSARWVREAGIEVNIRIEELREKHPNAYQLTLSSVEQEHRMVALSTGGGMIEVIELDGAQVSWLGDCFQTLVWADGNPGALQEAASRLPDCDRATRHGLEGSEFVAIRSTQPLDPGALREALPSASSVRRLRVLRPVLPVLSHRELSVPFTTCDGMMAFNQGNELRLWELAAAYECTRGQVSREVVVEKMLEIVRILRQSIAEGLAGTAYADRILGHQCGRFREKMDAGQLLGDGLLNRTVLYVTALMEVKSSMGVIVAAPTAGACAAMPAAVIAAGAMLGKTDEDVAQAFLAAGIIGTFVTIHSSFAAEVGGCQAEGGTAGAMAAAALVELMGGTAEQAVAAASMTLQGMLGLACDPIANRVEAPCLNKNVLAASNALSCANMALADFDPLIPLDQVIEAHARISQMMPREIRCTALGGLSVTPASKAIGEGHFALVPGAIGPKGEETFLQSKDFYYLCGIEISGAYLLVSGGQGRSTQLIDNIRRRFPHLTLHNLTPVMDELRSVKTPPELARLRHAGNLTAEGIREAMRSTAPGIYEYQLDAVMRYHFIAGGGSDRAYNSIIATLLFEFSGHVSHAVGLNCHEGLSLFGRGNHYLRPFEPGMVFSVDPTVESKLHCTYVRVEDTVAVTEDGVENLTAAAPLELDDVEALMREDGMLQTFPSVTLTEVLPGAAILRRSRIRATGPRGRHRGHHRFAEDFPRTRSHSRVATRPGEGLKKNSE